MLRHYCTRIKATIRRTGRAEIKLRGPEQNKCHWRQTDIVCEWRNQDYENILCTDFYPSMEPLYVGLTILK